MKQLPIEQRFCIDCKTPTKGYGIRCPKCNNIFTHSTLEFKQKASERMNKRYENPEARKIVGEQVKQRYLENPELWANRIKGKKHHKYNPNKYGRDYVKYCVDCHSPLSRLDAERCRTCSNTGKNNPNYLHGEYQKDYIGFTETLKQEIRIRDNNKCQLCSMDNDEHLLLYNCSLPVHHIDYNKENPSKSNLISLCIQCHLRTNYDRLYWQDYFKTNFNRDYWKEYFMNNFSFVKELLYEYSW